MGIFEGFLLASDYDGTLYGSTPVVSQGNLAAIRYFQREGGIFLVATGRCWSTFHEQAALLPLNQPTLLSNGAAFCRMETGENLFCHCLPQRSREDVMALTEEFPEVGLEVYHGEEIFCHNPNRFVEEHNALVGTTYEVWPVPEMTQPWLKVLLEAETPVLQRVRDRVLERWSQHYECIFSNTHLLELTAKGVHKGAGVLEAARCCGIDPEHIFCIGDNDNDLPMLRAARIGFAPEGSVLARRKEPGIQFVRDADHDSVAAAIEFLEEWVKRNGT